MVTPTVTLPVRPVEARLLAVALQAHADTGRAVQQLLDALVADHAALHGAALLDVNVDDGVLTFRGAEPHAG